MREVVRRCLLIGVVIVSLTPFAGGSETDGKGTETAEPEVAVPNKVDGNVEEPPLKTAELRDPKTNSVSPAFVGGVLSVGTAAWIVSDVDWGDDKAEPPDDTLPAPSTISPEGTLLLDGAIVSFRWKAVKGAAGYLVDVDLCAQGSICSDFRLERVGGTEWAVEWPAGVTAGRWRVRAIDAQNYAGRWSEFAEFRILAAP